MVGEEGEGEESRRISVTAKVTIKKPKEGESNYVISTMRIFLQRDGGKKPELVVSIAAAYKTVDDE